MTKKIKVVDPKNDKRCTLENVLEFELDRLKQANKTRRQPNSASEQGRATQCFDDIVAHIGKIAQLHVRSVRASKRHIGHQRANKKLAERSRSPHEQAVRDEYETEAVKDGETSSQNLHEARQNPATAEIIK